MDIENIKIVGGGKGKASDRPEVFFPSEVLHASVKAFRPDKYDNQDRGRSPGPYRRDMDCVKISLPSSL